MADLFERLAAPPPAGVAVAPLTVEELAALRRAERWQLWFGLSLGILFVVAELSSPGPLIIVTAINFVLASACFVVHMARSWASGVLVVVRKPVARRAAFWGVGLAVVGRLVADRTPAGRAGSIMFIAGVLVLYLSAGTWIVRRRFEIWQALGGPQPPQQSKQLRWVAVSVGGALIGCVLLALGALILGFIVLGLSVLMLPGAISLLAEYANHDLPQGVTAHPFRVVLAATALIAVGVAVSFVPARSNGLSAAVLIGLALVVVMVVTATLADIAVVLLLLALVGVSAPSSPALDDPWPSDKHVIVALGDSYLSGEGARQFIDGTDRAGVNECRRARTAWPVLVADREPFDGLVFLACSGARTYNLRPVSGGATSALGPAPESQYEQSSGTQLDDYANHYANPDAPLVTAPPLVVLSLGGNDAGFASIGLTCLAPGSCNDATPNDLYSKGNLDRVRNRLRQAYTEVRRTFPSSAVVVVPYPDPVDVDHAPCSQAPLEAGDVTFISTLLTKLDTVIDQTRKEYGFYFADTMQTSLRREHLQLCDPLNHRRAGINFLNAQSVGGISGDRFNPLSWKHGSLHPNELGHAALARAFEAWLAAQDPAHVKDPTLQGSVAAGLAALQPATTVVGAPKPVLVDESDKKLAKDDCGDIGDKEACNKQAQSWAYEQVGRFLLDPLRLLAILLVALGAWAIGLVLVRRP